MEQDLGPIQLQRMIEAYLEAGRLMEAMVVAKKARALFPDEPRFDALLAQTLERLHR